MADAEERNVISGNGLTGVTLRGNDQSVAGNYIGTDLTGTLAVPAAGRRKPPRFAERMRVTK